VLANKFIALCAAESTNKEIQFRSVYRCEGIIIINNNNTTNFK